MLLTSRIKFFIMIFVILSGYWEHYPNRVNYPSLSVNSMSLGISSTLTFPPLHWVINFDRLTIPAKKKKRSRMDSKFRWSLLLAVECLYGDTRLCKVEVNSIFTILARGVFRSQLNIFDVGFCKYSSRLSTLEEEKRIRSSKLAANV